VAVLIHGGDLSDVGTLAMSRAALPHRVEVQAGGSIARPWT
jgi:hypothetical protein